MKVVFLKDVGGVGARGSVKEVADGYALNYLIPRKLAEQATAAKVSKVEGEMAAHAALEKTRDALGNALAKQLDGAKVTVAAKANDKGHLYKQLSAEDVTRALKSELKEEIPAQAIYFGEHIKSLGESQVTIKLGTHSARVTVVTVAA